MEFLIKLILALLVLFYASLLDWRYREINDASWLALVFMGIVFIAVDVARTGVTTPLLYFLISVGVTSALMLAFSYFNLLGGGDAKIFIGIASLFPYYHREVTTVFPIFALSVFANAITLSLALPVYFFLRNLPHLKRVRSAKEFYALFLGYKKNASEIKPYEAVYGNGKSFTFLLRTDAELGKAEGEGEVWVTPAVPFVIPITISVLLSALYGDIISAIILFLRGS
jgi:preflagellin peptidase FlaK